MTATSTRPATPSLRRHAYAVGGAVLATALLWTAARSLGVELRVDARNGRPPQVVGLPLVAGSTLVVSLLASATRKWLDRLTDRASTVWTRLAVTVLLVSLAPMTYVQASGSAKATLALMHLAVAAVLVPLLARANGDRPGKQQHARNNQSIR
ncbi:MULTISPECIES: DUF6069 family protein [unclassified Streptomyces]|uniref:DUF6069 family protein n=1 Tax=unclassified Streptomyces TaxID=2593676 RepID=UPI002DDBCE81|nr:DUF6069 family protein [Streptomyces sp. NBC_01750]WSB04975.1 DUF6069 family protein [Streptomyces sp. NBC_01794]WSD30752.1 DUF6069 family protein [Streptomyces sp. NBC_01750]